jgi:hypothetical protein
MALSGSVDFTLTANGIINAAFSKIGEKILEQPLQSAELQDGLVALNMMLKSWNAQGIHLWTKEEGVVFLDKGKTDYLLGPGGDEATTLDDFVGTTTTAAKIATDTIFAVTSTAGMTAGDRVGIELDDGARFWTTIVTVDSAVQITITTGIPSASKSGSTVFTFTNLIERPSRILSYRRKTFNQDNEIQVMSWSRQEYFNQVNKSSQGTVVNAYYSPQLTNGRMYVWQTASSVNDFVRITFERSIQDIDLSTNNVDFPAEWLEAIVYNLAMRLADDYDTPLVKVQSITAKAVEFLDNLLGFDIETENIAIQPSRGL